jgi:hypothetical protein
MREQLNRRQGTDNITRNFIRYGTNDCFISTYASQLHQVRYLWYAVQLLVPALVALSVPMPYNFLRYGTCALQLQVPTLCSSICTYALQLHQVRYLRFTTSGTYAL